MNEIKGFSNLNSPMVHGDVDVSIDEANSNFNDLANWQDPNGDKLILGVIGQVCRVEN